MSKYNFKDSHFSAKNIHIGDVYHYSSPSDFVDRENSIKLSKTEKELVAIIFENTANEQERQSILESLKAIKSDEVSLEEKKKSISKFKPLINFLKQSGNKIALKVTTELFDKYATQYNIIDLIAKLFN
jgi:methionine synthase II (cobalamin-independent)